jgi:hypothetical protein
MKRLLRQTSARSALLGVAVLAGCSGEAKPGSQTAEDDPLGTFELALGVSGYTIDTVTVTLTSQALVPAVTRVRSIDVSDPNAAVSATEYGLPPGRYDIGLSAHVVDDPTSAFDESTIACKGSLAGVIVRPGAITQVDDLTLLCTRDGGQVQTLGGVSIGADVATSTINNCPDLIGSVSISPLETSVGAAIALSASLAPDTTIAWSAVAGTFSADGSSFTCPAVAGTFTLQATVKRADGCQQTMSQQVKCHNSYQGSCEALPSAFAFEGSCGLRSPCYTLQNGCDWQINCRGQTVSGEGEGNGSFPFIHTNGRACSASLVEGELKGSCTDAAGATCDFATNVAPPATPFCEKLPTTINDVTACGVTYRTCNVIQAGCTYQASCDGGAAVLSGSVVDDQLQWNPSVDGKSYRCQGPIVDGAVSGTCTQTGSGVTSPATCDDYAASVPVAPAACEETLPSEGFALAGCGLDGNCFAVQRGCLWQVACDSGTYAGTADATNAFSFTGADGRACSAAVKDGKFTGSCEGGGESCGFAPALPALDTSCFQVPAHILWQGCGTVTGIACNVFQNGCDFVASCQNGQLNFAGLTGPSDITFPGLAGYTCNAALNESSTALYGQCTRENENGTVSTCRDLTDQIGARLAITWPSAE